SLQDALPEQSQSVGMRCRPLGKVTLESPRNSVITYSWGPSRNAVAGTEAAYRKPLAACIVKPRYKPPAVGRMNSMAESGGVRSTTRARSSAGRPIRYAGETSGWTDGGRESAGGAWYSVNPIWPTRAGSVAGSTGPLALRTYTPGVTPNPPASDRPT